MAFIEPCTIINPILLTSINFSTPELIQEDEYSLPSLGDIDGLVQERRNAIANALVLSLSCTNISL